MNLFSLLARTSQRRKFFFYTVALATASTCSAVHAAGTVTAPTEAALRAALRGGGTVSFAIDGTIELAQTVEISANTTLNGNGHRVVLSGNHRVRVLKVNRNVALHLSEITVANGSAMSAGGGLYNEGGRVTLERCTFFNNQVVGQSGSDGEAGANGAEGPPYWEIPQHGEPGEVGNWGENGGAGGAGGEGAPARGGAIYQAGGTLSSTNCTFAVNVAIGGTGGNGGRGGTGGNGGQGQQGGYSYANPDDPTPVFGSPGGDGGNGGDGGHGGNGGRGGQGQGSAIFAAGTVSLLNCTFSQNTSIVGPGGFGGGAGNGGQGGQGGPGGTPDAENGFAGSAGSSAEEGEKGSDGPSGSTLAQAQDAASPFITLHNTLLSSPLSTSNCANSATDTGHNLASDNSCGLGASSQSSTSPHISGLNDNGGSVRTIALFTNSAAIDAADDGACPATDARGVARPQGAHCDIGAYEGSIADTVAPTIAIVTPIGATRTAPYIGGTVEDNVGRDNVVRVVLTLRRADGTFWNGLEWTLTPVLLSTQLHDGSWARSLGDLRGSLTAQRYTIQAYAFDADGNRGTARGEFTLDLTPPQVQITSPTTGAYARSLTRISGTMSDVALIGPSGNVAGQVTRIEVILQRTYLEMQSDGSGGTLVTNERILPAMLGRGTWSVDVSDLLNQATNCVAIARAFDAAGNQTKSAPVVFKVDAAAPFVQFEAPLHPTAPVALRTLNHISGIWQEQYEAPRIAVSLVRRRDGRYWNGTT